MKDNITPHASYEYDQKILKILPFYEQFHDSTLDLVYSVNPQPKAWLDTGCGTGIFIKKALANFPDTAFFLADPAASMLNIAKKFSNNIINMGTAELDFSDGKFDVITANLAHHFLQPDERRLATMNCFRMLKSGGIYVTFECIRPNTSVGINIAMKRWYNFKLENGISKEKAKEFYSLLDVEFHPITLSQHMKLLENCGFKTNELLWMTYMHAGFYAIKQ